MVSLQSLRGARIERVLAYIERHLGMHMTIAMLSHEAGMSPFHFARLFRRRIGASPHEYVTRRRMQRAADDLLLTDMPVSDIASGSGYERPGHYAAAFKCAYGDNPMAGSCGMI